MIRRLLLGAVLFAGGFVLFLVLIHLLVGDPLLLYADGRSEKLAILNGTDADVCTASFGTSRIHNGFDPRAFDETLRAAGIDISSVNLAIEGGSQTEQYIMAQRFLQTRAGDLRKDRCLLLLEINAGANFANRHLVHPRSINIYDADVDALGATFAPAGMPLTRRLGRLAFVAAASAMHYLNLGALANRLFPHDMDAGLYARETAADRRGLLIEPPIDKDTREVDAFFAAGLAEPLLRPAELFKGDASLVERLSRQRHGASVTYLYVVSPKLEDLKQYDGYPPCIEAGAIQVEIINVAQPPAFPELYRRRYWHDLNHLNEAGAAVFSRLLAEQIAQRRSAAAPATACTQV